VASALIGYTGFVGQTLLRQARFEDLFNRSNIEEVRGRSYSLVACAGAPAAKWYANQHPEEDRANLGWLMSCLSDVRAEVFALVSTVDVYPRPVGVDEATPIDPEDTQPYGRHRLLLERFVADTFPGAVILRLPGLFGPGLKKNTIYDFLTSGSSPLTNPESVFQYYDVENLWGDMEKVIRTDLPLVNMATEPIGAQEIARACSVPEEWESGAPTVTYDMRTRHAERLGARGRYFYSSDAVLRRLRSFAERMKATP
jgi:nucleoside-diphosphate-sugar epimerase